MAKPGPVPRIPLTPGAPWLAEQRGEAGPGAFVPASDSVQRGNRAGRSPVRCGHGRCVVIVSAHRPWRLVEHVAGRAPVTTGAVPPGAEPAPEKESEESQEQGDCPFDSFHGDSFQGVWEYLPRI